MRQRREPPKVWHNPEIAAPRRRGGTADATRADDANSRHHRAALDALFAPRPDPATEPEAKRRDPAGKAPGRIVARAAQPSDPAVLERDRLLAKLLGAEGRPKVTKAADDFLRAGHTFPNEQDVWLKLLEHGDEEQVRCAMEGLTALLAVEPPKRRAVLDSRLRRLEEFADDDATRALAAKLRKLVAATPDTPPRASGRPPRGRDDA